jgi:hypothetical protein
LPRAAEREVSFTHPLFALHGESVKKYTRAAIAMHTLAIVLTLCIALRPQHMH